MHFQLFIIAFVLILFGMFCLYSLLTHRHLSARVQKQGGSPFLGVLPMEFAYWILSPIQKTATSLKLSPNFFSWTCLALGVCSGVFGAFGAIGLAGGVSILSALFDTLDGMVARSLGIASDAGEVLDAAVDRYTEFFLLGGFCIYYRFSVGAMTLVLFALLGSMLVSYSQAKAEAMKVEIPKGWMRRPERAAYLGAGAFLSPLLSSWFEPTSMTQHLWFESTKLLSTEVHNIIGATPLMHYPLLFAITLVAVFANTTAVWRFYVLYKKLSSNKEF